MKKLILTRMETMPVSFLFEEDALLEVDVESEKGSNLNNIYIGKVKNIVPNIQAAFVEYQKGKNGFLSLTPELANLREGDELPVQIIKDAIKMKDPVLSTKLSLSGDFCAVSYGDSRIGYSAKLSRERKSDLKAALKGKLEALQTVTASSADCAPAIGIVIRTSAEDVSVAPEQIFAEAAFLMERLKALIVLSKSRTVYSCLYQSDSFWLQKYRQVYLQSDCEVITDQEDMYEVFQEFSSAAKKKTPNNLRLYKDATYPLNALYGLHAKFKEAVSTKVWLKSGGFLIIEATEALTVIDVNSGKNITGKEKEAMFLQLNCEAALESARQLRLRNISGIVIIDFVNCKEEAGFIQVLKEAIKKDPVKTSFIDITPLGLVELTRKKISAPLQEKIRKADCHGILKL